MQALILAGGKGTRLRPLTVYTPKPIVPVVNRALLLYQIDILKRAGITDITLSLSYQPDKIEHLIGHGTDQGVTIRYVTEPSPMGTAGAYRFAMDSCTETTVVLNGDILTDIDIDRIVEFHKERGASATVALTRVHDPSKFGVVAMEGDGRITRFIEKPSVDDLKVLDANTINAGVYVLEPKVQSEIQEGVGRSFEYDIFPQLLSKDLPFYGFVMEGGYWCDIGTPNNYLSAHHAFLAGEINGFEPPVQDRSEVATRADVDKASVLGEGCIVKPGANIINSVIGAGVHIEEKARIQNSVIWAHTRVAAAAEIDNAIVGRSCHIGRNAVVGPDSVLGDKTSLTDYTQV